MLDQHYHVLAARQNLIEMIKVISDLQYRRNGSAIQTWSKSLNHYDFDLSVENLVQGLPKGIIFGPTYVIVFG